MQINECTDLESRSRAQAHYCFNGTLRSVQTRGRYKYIVDFEQALAGFLLVRGRWAWLGYSWMSCYGDFGRGGAGQVGSTITL